jgi:acetylornithine deacetylase/succinyl-diaminopimelate desuccinylase-like protein
MTTPAERQAVYDRLTQRFPEFVEALSEYGRVATISARSEAAEAGAEATRRVLERYGVPARLMPVPDGPPLVVGEIVVDPELPTLILYNHYDVQPVDPRGEWTHDPFTPVVEDGKLFGRGVADTKGNVVAQALAQAVIREVRGTLPLNLRFMVEGEEEIGSPHLGAFARQHPDLFRGSAACVEAGSHGLDGCAQVFMGNKGILYVELRARTADVDQHSSLAAVIPNPAWRLLAALRAIRDDRGRIRIPGFYAGIQKPAVDALAYLARNPFDPIVYRRVYGARGILGGRTRLDRLKAYCYHPTCNIDGLLGGYAGEGSKTINPAWAAAKLDFRLIPGQRPARILASLKAHLRRRGFGDLEVISHSTFEPGATPVSAPVAQAAIAACREVYGRPPGVFPWAPGSSTTGFYTRHGTAVVKLTGVGYVGSRVHAPDEHIRLDDARRAIRVAAGMMLLFAERAGSRERAASRRRRA